MPGHDGNDSQAKVPPERAYSSVRRDTVPGHPGTITSVRPPRRLDQGTGPYAAGSPAASPALPSTSRSIAGVSLPVKVLRWLT